MKPESGVIKKRYDRIAPFFDLIEAPMEGMVIKPLRRLLWTKVEGHHILEVGVGTGKNFPYYPKDARITAIDFSPEMLNQAAIAKIKQDAKVDLELMDVQTLCYADNSFDTVVATFVFCSVPLPVKGLKELHRVCKPGGQILLLEHVLSSNPVLAFFMNLLNPIVVRIFGANINCNTLKNVQACQFSSVRVDEQSGHLIKLIEARK